MLGSGGHDCCRTWHKCRVVSGIASPRPSQNIAGCERGLGGCSSCGTLCTALCVQDPLRILQDPLCRTNVMQIGAFAGQSTFAVGFAGLAGTPIAGALVNTYNRYTGSGCECGGSCSLDLYPTRLIAYMTTSTTMNQMIPPVSHPRMRRMLAVTSRLPRQRRSGMVMPMPMMDPAEQNRFGRRQGCNR